MTVLELKTLVKDRNVLMFGPKKNKADYVQALRDDDSYKKDRNDFHTGLEQMAAHMQASRDSINNSLAKIKEARTEFDVKIKSLKEKEDKTIKEWELLVTLLESRMKLMKDF